MNRIGLSAGNFAGNVFCLRRMLSERGVCAIGRLIFLQNRFLKIVLNIRHSRRSE